MSRVAMVLASTALLLLASDVANAQVGGGGSIQGTVRDASNAPVPGATVTATNVATGIATVRQTTTAGVYAVTPLPPGEYRVTVTLDGFERFVREGLVVDALSVVGLNVTLQVAGIKQEVVVTRGVTAARDRRRQARPDDPERSLHRAAARPEHRRAARSDRVHVPDARRAVDRTLGQRHGRPGLHHRHVRRGDSDHERRRPGRRPQPVVRHLGRRRRPVPGRDQRHRRDVQRPGRLQLRRQVRARTRSTAARSSTSETRRSTRRRSSPRSSRPTTSTSTASRSAVRCARTRCSSSSPTTDTATAAQTASRLTSIPTAAERNGDFSALPVAIYDPRTTQAQSQRHRLRARSVSRATSSRAIGSRRSRDTSSHSCPTPTSGGLQNNYLGGALPTGFNNENVTGKVDLQDERTAAALGAVRARQAQPGDAVPRRDQPADGAAACRTRRRASSKRSPPARRSSTRTCWVRRG